MPAPSALVLFVTESVWPLVLVLDVAIAMVALIDLTTLAEPGGCGWSGTWAGFARWMSPRLSSW